MKSQTKNVTLVISADDATTEQIIKRSAPIFAENRWRAEVIQVTPDSSPKEDKTHKRFSNLADGLRAAEASTVILLDGNPLLDADYWRWAEKRLDVQPVQCLHGPSSPSRGFSRLLKSAHNLIAHSLLKHAGNEFTPSVTFIDNQSITISGLIDAISHLPAAEQSGWRLMSALKMSDQQNVSIKAFPVATLSHDHKLTRPAQIIAAIQSVAKLWFSDTMFPADPASDTSSQAQKKLGRGTVRLGRIAAWSVLLLVTLAMLGTQLSYPLFEPDETRNAQLALNILDSGQWMALQLHGQHYWDKPPLMAWLTATSYQVFGVSEASTRIPCIAIMAACVFALLYFGKRLVGFRAAWISSMLMLLCCGMPFAGRYLTMDAALTLCATIVACCVYLGSFSGRFKKHWWIVAGFAAGIGLLAKGPVILVLSVPPILLFSWITGKRVVPTWKSNLYWALPCLLVAGPWFIGTFIGTPEFLHYFIWKHHVVRFSAAFDHRQPFWFYIPIILLVMFPASQLFLPLLKFAGTRKPEIRALRTKAHGYLILFAGWQILFFSCAQSKLPTYIFPAIPAMCLLFGSMLDINVFQKLTVGSLRELWLSYDRKELQPLYQRLPKWFGLNLTAWIIISSIAIAVFLPMWKASLLLMVASALLVGTLAYISSHRRVHPVAAWIAVGGLAFFMSSLIINRLVPAISEYRSVIKSIASMKTDPQYSDLEIVYFGRDDYGTRFRLPSEKITHFPETELHLATEYLTNHPNAILVSTADHIKELRKMLTWNVRIQKDDSARHVYRTTHTNDVQVKHIANGKPDNKDALR